MKFSVKIKTMLAPFVAGAFLFSAFSCSNTATEATSVSGEGAHIISTEKFEETVKTNPSLTAEIIKLEASAKEQLIGKVDKIIYKNGKFHILDRTYAKAVYVFDKEGQFEFRIKRRGLGPGEYNECWDMDVDDEGNIYVMGINMNKVIQYNSKGKYEKEATYGFTSFNFCNVAPDTFALYQLSRVHDVEELNHDILYWDTKGYISNRLFPYSVKQMETLSTRRAFFTRNENSVLFSKNFCDTIFDVTNMGLEAKYIFKRKESEYYKKSFQIPVHKERFKYLFKSDVPWNFHNYMEDGYTFTCCYFYKSDVGIVTYDKNTEKTDFYLFDDIKKEHARDLKPFGLCDGKLMGAVMPSKLKELQETHIVKELGLPESEFYADSLQAVNPYIVLYNIKS